MTSASSKEIRQRSAYDIGTVHAYRGDGDAAVAWLERAFRQRDGSMFVLKVDPLLRNLRTTPATRCCCER